MQHKNTVGSRLYTVWININATKSNGTAKLSFYIFLGINGVMHEKNGCLTLAVWMQAGIAICFCSKYT